MNRAVIRAGSSRSLVLDEPARGPPSAVSRGQSSLAGMPVRRVSRCRPLRPAEDPGELVAQPLVVLGRRSPPERGPSPKVGWSAQVIGLPRRSCSRKRRWPRLPRTCTAERRTPARHFREQDRVASWRLRTRSGGSLQTDGYGRRDGNRERAPGQALTTAQPGQSPPAVALNSPAVYLGSAVGTALARRHRPHRGSRPEVAPYRTAALAPLCRGAANGQRRFRPGGALRRLEPATASPSVTLAGGPQSVRKDPSRQVRQTKM